MKTETGFTRREALAAGVLLPLLLSGLRGAEAEKSEAATVLASPRDQRLKFGVATYSFRQLSLDATIAALTKLQVTSVSAFRNHLPLLGGSPEACRSAAEQFRHAGITIASTGVVKFTRDEAAARQAFECARAAGLSLMACTLAEKPDSRTFGILEGLVREYQIRLAIHNHGPEDPHYASPYDVWKVVESLEPGIGLCLDVGHATRAGVNVPEAVLHCRSRLYDVHLKDTLSPNGDKKDLGVDLGYGRVDVRGIIAALVQIGYTGQVGLEDEVISPDPLPGVATSYGYMRGVLAGLPA